MSELTNRYVVETGKKAMYIMPGTAASYHFLEYVTWLEAKLLAAQSEIAELKGKLAKRDDAIRLNKNPLDIFDAINEKYIITKRKEI